MGTVATSAESPAILLIGGYDENVAACREVFAYTPREKTWTQHPGLPEQRSAHAAVALGNTVHVLGGSYKGIHNTVFVLDLSRGKTWTEIDHMQERRSDLAAAIADSAVVAIGGIGGAHSRDSKFLASVEHLNRDTGCWEDLCPMQEARRSLAAVNLDSSIYAIGGFVSQGASKGRPLSSIEYFDPWEGVWRCRASMQEARCGHVASVAGIRILVAGGKGANDEELVTAEVYNACTNIWQSLPVGLKAARWGASCAALPGHAFILGGFDGGLLKCGTDWDWEAECWQCTADQPAARFGSAAVAIFAPASEKVERMFSTSNYKKYDEVALPFGTVNELWEGAQEFLIEHLKRKDMHKTSTEAAVKQWSRICRTAVKKKEDELKRGSFRLEVTAACIWTSSECVGNNDDITFFKALNDTLRDDPESEVLRLATRYARTVRRYIVNRKPEDRDGVRWPQNYCIYRGTYIPKVEVDFFTQDKEFRAVAFLAGSEKEDIAKQFLVPKPSVKDGMLVMFQIFIDRVRTCRHVHFLEGFTLVQHEHEYLFPPYSAFTVLKVEKVSGKPTVIDLLAHYDNQHAREDLPLALWI